MIYIIVFSISVILMAYAQKSNFNGTKANILTMLGILIPCILAGVRDYSIGNDVLEYGNIWFERALQSNSMISYLKLANRQSIGYGYAFLNYFVSRMTNCAHVFYFVLSLFEFIILFNALKYYKKELNIPFAFLIYFFVYYNNSLNILRQIVAVLFVLYSFKFVYSRKLFKFLLCILLAMLFHSTAVIGILLYPLSILAENKYKKIINVISYIGMVVIVIFFAKFMEFFSNLGIINSERYLSYIEDKNSIGGRYVRLIFFSILLIYFICNMKKTKFKMINSLRNYCFFSVTLSILSFIYLSAYITRIAMYFDIFMVMYIPLVSGKVCSKNNMRVVKAKPILMGGIFMIYWLLVYVIRNGASTYPYMFMKS